jgi:two-component system cell cycle response regulator DivK
MATQHLRKNPALHHVPIVALTANIMPQVLDEMITAGCEGYITKPVSVDTLPDQILRFLKNGRKNNGH